MNKTSILITFSLFRTSLPANENEMGKRVRRALNKPEEIEMDQESVHSESNRSQGEDDRQDDDQIEDNQSDDAFSGEYSPSNEPEPSKKMKSTRKRGKSSRSTRKKSKKRARSNRSPTDSSDFHSGSSIYEDEYDLMN